MIHASSRRTNTRDSPHFSQLISSSHVFDHLRVFSPTVASSSFWPEATPPSGFAIFAEIILWAWRRDRRVPLTRLLLGLALIGPLRGAEVNLQLESALAAVQKANEQKRYPEALQLARDAVQRFPNSSEAWRHRALATRLSGDLPAALQDYAKAIELDPRNVSAWSGRGQCRRALKDYPAAIADFDQALAINPRYIPALALRADTRTDLADLRGALVDVEALIALDARRPESFHSRMYIRNKLKDWKGMEADCNRILELNPNYSKSIHYARGLARAELGRHKEAIADFETCIAAGHQTEQAVARKKKSQDALAAKGGFLAKLAQFEKQVDAVLGASGGGPASGGATAPVDPGTSKSAPPPASTPVPKRAEPRVSSAPAVTVTRPTETPPPKATPARPDVNVTITPPAKTEPLEQPVPPLPENDRPWAQDSSPWPRIKPALPPLEVRPALDIKRLTVAQFNGVISAAMEAMRLVQEPMTAAETAKFEKKWAPLFNFPTEQSVEYFKQLNPLLDEFLMLRGVIAQAANAVDEAWVEAKFAAAYESETGTREAMAIVAHQTTLMKCAQAQLGVVVEKIAALGNPPNPIEARAIARKRHDVAVKTVERLLPVLTLTPAKLDSQPGQRCTLTPKAANLPARVTLSWTFGDGGKTTTDFAPVEHTFAKEGRYTVQVVALDAGKQALARASAEVTIGKTADTKGQSPGAWILTRVERHDLKPVDFKLRDNSALKEVEYSDAAFTLSGYGGSHWNSQVKGKLAWGLPPPKLKPREPIQIPWTGELASGPNSGHLSLWFLVSCLYEGETDERGLDGDTFKIRESGVSGNFMQPNGLAPPQSGQRKIRSYLIRIKARANYLTRMDSDPEFAGQDRVFHYGYDPTGAAKPLAEGVVAGSSAVAPATAEEKARQNAIAEHQNNIAAIEKFLARDRDELGRTADPRNRAALEWRILTAKADIQAEKDLIASMETGEYVHTRTEYDEVTHAQFVGNIQRQQQQLSAILKIMDRSERLIAIAPPAEQERLREFARRQLSPDLIAKMDLAKARQAMEAIGGQVQAHYEGAAARQDEKAAWAQFGMEAASNIKTAADTGIMLTSMFGGQPINLLYQAGTGYVEGGPAEAIKRAATTYSDAIDYAVTAYDGYQHGGLGGAARDLAWKYVDAKSVSLVAGAFMRGRGRPDTKRPAGHEQLEAAKFRRERALGEARVKDFQRAQLALQDAGRSGASPEAIMRLQAAARDKASAVAESLHAKNYLKYKCDPFTGKAYDSHQRAIHAEVDARVKQQMAKAKWNADEWELREFRNESSYGKPNMDRDVGLREKSLWDTDKDGHTIFDADGRPVPNPERWEMRNGTLVPKPQVTKDKKPMTLHQWQEEAKEAYNRAYQEVTGRSAAKAMEGVTTSVHPEAYKDLAWLESDKSRVNAGWGAQAADVTRYKVHAPEHAAPDASYFTKMQEVARGTSKDLETKLLPILESARPQGSTPASLRQSEQHLAEARRHWTKINSILSAYGRNEIDPIYATRRLREITGGKSIPEVVDEMGTLLEATLKLGR